jgi:hypothetical protein
MTKFRLLLVVLCLGLMGAQQQAAAQSGTPVSAQIGAPLMKAKQLTEAGEHKQAMAVINGLEAVPNKTAYELSIIGQMRTYVQVKSSGVPVPNR